MSHLKNTKLLRIALGGLLFTGLWLASASAQIGISISVAPPPIPIYEQPYCPVEGYLWTPGYWAYDSDYYWVPGVWVAPPRIGVLWTPGYWGYNGGTYLFNEGYWGPTVGFYGGINYGFGYVGNGYYGGQWAGDSFRYNTAFSRVDANVIRNVYVNKEVVNNNGNRASFNGPGGITAKPSAEQLAAAKAEHLPATAEQRSRVEAAKNNPALHASTNHGKPNAEAMTALDGNKSGQGANGTGPQPGGKNGKGTAANQLNGNSAFGQGQGDAATRTRGRQNNAHGKAESANAFGSGRNSHSLGATGPNHRERAMQARNMNSATGSSPHTARHAEGEFHRQQNVPARRVSPGGNDRGPRQNGQPEQKNKKHPRDPQDGNR